MRCGFVLFSNPSAALLFFFTSSVDSSRLSSAKVFVRVYAHHSIYFRFLCLPRLSLAAGQDGVRF